MPEPGWCIGVTQVDFVLSGTGLMVGVFDGDAHLLEKVHRRAAEVHARAARHMVEIASLIDGRGRHGEVILLFKQVELNLRMRVEREALFFRLAERALEHVTGVAERWRAFGREHIAEHACRALGAAAPRQNLEGRGIGLGDHVVLRHARQSFHRRTIEAQSFFEGRFEFRRCDSDGLQLSEHIGEPQTDEVDVSLLHGAHDELLLFIHKAYFPPLMLRAL